MPVQNQDLQSRRLHVWITATFWAHLCVELSNLLVSDRSFGRLPGAYSPIPVQLRKAAAASGKDLVRLGARLARASNSNLTTCAGLTMQPKEPCDEVCDKILNRMLVSVDVQNRSQADCAFRWQSPAQAQLDDAAAACCRPELS